METRVKELFRNIQNGEIEKSALAAHVWKEKHAMDNKPVLLKQAANKQEWTNWENILITKNKDRVINFEIPPTDHLTKKFILNPVEGSRSASTRISKQDQSVMGWQWGQCPWKRFPYIQVSDVLCYKPIPINHHQVINGEGIKKWIEDQKELVGGSYWTMIWWG